MLAAVWTQRCVLRGRAERSTSTTANLGASCNAYPPECPTHAEGRRRLCERVDAGRPLAHIADEGGVSRATLTNWYRRWLAFGEAGQFDRSSRPSSQPTRSPDDVEDMVIHLRQRDHVRGR